MSTNQGLLAAFAAIGALAAVFVVVFAAVFAAVAAYDSVSGSSTADDMGNMMRDMGGMMDDGMGDMMNGMMGDGAMMWGMTRVDSRRHRASARRGGSCQIYFLQQSEVDWSSPHLGERCSGRSSRASAPALVVRQGDYGDGGGHDDSGDPPLGLRIALPRHLNAITGQDTEVIQRRAGIEYR